MYSLNATAVLCSLILLIILSTSLNIFCIYVIRTTKTLREKPSSSFVVNLLSVHTFQGCVVLPLYAGKKLPHDMIKSLVLRQIFGNGYRFTYILSFYGTCLGVLSIALDRFLASFLVSRYRSVVTAGRRHAYLTGLWIYILLLAAIPFVDFKGGDDALNDLTMNSTAVVVPKLYYYNHQPEWVVFMLLFNAALPLLLIIVCYIYIVVTLKNIETVRMIDASRSLDRTNPLLLTSLSVDSAQRMQNFNKYKEVSYLTLALALTYGVCWTPSIINYILMSICSTCFPENYEDSKVETIVSYLIKYLAYTNAVFSPLIYCFYHSEFRKALRVMRWKCSQEDELMTPVNTSSGETSFMVSLHSLSSLGRNKLQRTFSRAVSSAGAATL